MECAALACRDFPHPHTGARIKDLLEKIFDEHSLDLENVIRFTTDKGSNVVLGLKPFRVVQKVPEVASLDDVDGCVPAPVTVPSTSSSLPESFVEIELDFVMDDDDDSGAGSDLEDEDREEDEEEDGFQPLPAAPTISALPSTASTTSPSNPQPVMSEEEMFYEAEEFYKEAFPKRLTCVAHALNLIFHKVLDNDETLMGKTRKKILNLLKKINASGVFNQKLKQLAGKKLLKIAKTRWNSYFYVLHRLLQLKNEIVEICREKLWGINFDWNDVEKFVALMKPLAIATTFLEGDKYPTAAAVIPSILSLQDHFVAMKKDPLLAQMCELFLSEINHRFSYFMDVKDPDFDQTFLMCTMLHPQRTTDLHQELFSEGFRRLSSFLKSEIESGFFKPKPTASEESTEKSNAQAESSSNNQGILNIIFFFSAFYMVF